MTGQSTSAFVLFAFGWLFAGAGVVGQPHIMVRVMTIDRVDSMAKARRIYFVWNALFAAAAIIVGLAARASLTGDIVSDPELALPLLAQNLLPAILVGLVLAGIFAATMSTADSQVLSFCRSHSDIFPRWKNHYGISKPSTVMVTLVVLTVA